MTSKFPILDDLFNPFLPQNAVMFLRHAERKPILIPGKGMDVPLTQKGKISAFELGKNLPSRHKLLISHTGLLRTLETAEAIGKGFRSHGGSTHSLKMVPREMGKIIQSSRYYKFVEILGEDFVSKWLEGRVDPVLILPPEKAAIILLKRLFFPWISNYHDMSNPFLHIHIGHDWNVAALRTVLLGRECTVQQVTYLDGVVLSIDDIVMIRCLGSSKQVDSSVLKSISFIPSEVFSRKNEEVNK